MAAVHTDSYPVVVGDIFDGHDVANCVLAKAFVHALAVLVNNGLLELTGNASDGINPDKLPQLLNISLNIYCVFVELDVLMVLNNPDGMDVMPVPLNVPLNI